MKRNAPTTSGAAEPGIVPVVTSAVLKSKFDAIGARPASVGLDCPVPGAGAGVGGGAGAGAGVGLLGLSLDGVSAFAGFETLQPGKTASRMRGAASALTVNLNLVLTLPGPQFEPSPLTRTVAPNTLVNKILWSEPRCVGIFYRRMEERRKSNVNIVLSLR
jgi:hypothetical protein